MIENNLWKDDPSNMGEVIEHRKGVMKELIESGIITPMSDEEIETLAKKDFTM